MASSAVKVQAKHEKCMEHKNKRRREREVRVRQFMHSLKSEKLPPSKQLSTKTLNEPSHCPICTEHYSQRHKRLECPYSCGGEACTSCHTRYLKDATTDFHCMKCRREWTLRFMRTNFSEKQLQTVYKQYQQVLLARDETKLPTAQQVLEKETLIDRLYGTIQRLEKRIDNVKRRQEHLRENLHSQLEKDDQHGPPIKCPTTDCRGYLKRAICGVCKKRYCLKCMQQVARTCLQKTKQHKKKRKLLYEVTREALSEDCSSASSKAKAEVDAKHGDQKHDEDKGLATLTHHVCKAEDLANMKYLRENSKMCPKCGVWTSKTDGCDQMWCINCHAAWNWSTEKEVKGVIHNPHFFEWQRQNNHGQVARNPEDVPCGGLPLYFEPRLFADAEFLNKVLRRVNEINDTHIFRRPPRESNNLDLQLKYLRHEISREFWSSAMFRRYKRFKFHEQFFHIHQMFYVAATDILQRRKSQVIDATTVHQELDRLRLYYNQELLETVRVNKGRYPKLYNLLAKDWTTTTWEDNITVKQTLAAQL